MSVRLVHHEPVVLFYGGNGVPTFGVKVESFPWDYKGAYKQFWHINDYTFLTYKESICRSLNLSEEEYNKIARKFRLLLLPYTMEEKDRETTFNLTKI